MGKIQQLLEYFKNYGRPTRMVIWCICIAFTFIYCTVIRTEKSIDPLAEIILYGMFADLGIYTGARTFEKITAMKNGLQPDNPPNATMQPAQTNPPPVQKEDTLTKEADVAAS